MVSYDWCLRERYSVLPKGAGERGFLFKTSVYIPRNWLNLVELACIRVKLVPL